MHLPLLVRPGPHGVQRLRAWRRRLLPAWLLLAACAQGAGPPAYLGEALARFTPDVPNGWAYTVAVTRGVETSVESFDPAQPAGRQWTLLQHDGRAPTINEMERYRRYRETTDATTGARAAFARGDLDDSSAEVVHEDAGGAVVRFRFRPDAVEPMLAHLELYLALDKAPAAVKKSTLRLVQPYSPVFGMKMTELVLEMTYARPSASHPGLPVAAVSRFRGRILWFWTINENTQVAYANFRRVLPSVDRAMGP